MLILKKSNLSKNIKPVKIKELYDRGNIYDILIILNSHNIFDLKEIVKKCKIVIDVVNSCRNIKHKKIIKI